MYRSTMGSWDCYCAICGSTISGAIISEKPRTARFHKRRAEERREAAAAAAGQDAPVYEESDEDSDDNESLDSYDEEYSYDPAILSDEDIEWTSSLHILGFNPDANNVTKCVAPSPSCVMSDKIFQGFRCGARVLWGLCVLN